MNGLRQTAQVAGVKRGGRRRTRSRFTIHGGARCEKHITHNERRWIFKVQILHKSFSALCERYFCRAVLELNNFLNFQDQLETTEKRRKVRQKRVETGGFESVLKSPEKEFDVLENT